VFAAATFSVTTGVSTCSEAEADAEASALTLSLVLAVVVATDEYVLNYRRLLALPDFLSSGRHGIDAMTKLDFRNEQRNSVRCEGWMGVGDFALRRDKSNTGRRDFTSFKSVSVKTKSQPRRRTAYSKWKGVSVVRDDGSRFIQIESKIKGKIVNSPKVRLLAS
jgi:hypothetical protein